MRIQPAARGDRYYGATARNYDRKRSHRVLWLREAEAVDRLLRGGPVLDVPVGTGRYGNIYERRGLVAHGVDVSDDMLALTSAKHPWMTTQRASILDLPFIDLQYRTAVCTRLLNWLDADDAARALDELQRVAYDVIFSARIGAPGRHGRKTENRQADFLAGRNITHKILLQRSRDAEYCMFRAAAEPETPAELRARLDDECADAPRPLVAQANYQIDQWVKRGALARGWAVREEFELTREWWTAARTRAHLEGLRAYSAGAVTREPPRREPLDSSAVMIDCGGRRYHMDGRRRMNVWMKVPSVYSVLVIKAVRDE